jgi:hypothetical protein
VHSGFRVARRTACALVVTATIGLPTATSQAASVRVPDDYYGVNYQRVMIDHPVNRERHFASMASLGFTQVRFTIPWYLVEPNPPNWQGHHYRFEAADQLVAGAARHGLRVQATFAYTPRWNTPGSSRVFCDLFNSSSHKPLNLEYYARAAAAMVARYGDGGSFWDQHPELPYLPVRTWEIWNEPNLTSFWCPGPEPERYADMFVLAANRINSVDPDATLVIGGLPLESPSQQYLGVGDFLRRATGYRPQLVSLADAVGVHVYPYGSLDQQLNAIVMFRDELRKGGIPDDLPMLATEFGWTRKGPTPMTEHERVQRYARVPTEFPRTNCNVSGAIAHAWTSSEVDNSKPQAWFGIADINSGYPYPSAQAYAQAVALMRGQTSVEAPHGLLTNCAGMAAPDRDADGVPDHNDYHPLDSSRAAGPAGW